MILSILICSLFKRSEKLAGLLAQIYRQWLPGVEVLIEIDNKDITTGQKRNRLLFRAKGDYVVFIDDDDHIMDSYLSDILTALESRPDCVGMEGEYSVDGGTRIPWKLSKNYYDHDFEGVLYRRTNHISPVKRELALMAQFPDKSNAEDKAYSEKLIKLLKTEVFIPKKLYHYDYSTRNKEYR